MSQRFRCLFCGNEQDSNERNCTPAICGAYAWQPIEAHGAIKVTKENAPAILTNLRWQPNQLVENPHGQIVYLKQGDGCITDCCFADDPCERHEGKMQ